MAYLVNFRLNAGLDFDCDLIDEEAIFLSMDMNKINTWAKTTIRTEIRHNPGKWIAIFNSIKWEREDDMEDTISYIKELDNGYFFNILCSEIPLIA